VSGRAYKALDDAKTTFLRHLASVDVSKGAVTAEIIQFHLVPDMKKSFNKFVKDYGCTATSRKITREEQDKVNKTRKSLMQFTSVKVTPEAQKAFLEKHPRIRKKLSGSSTTSNASTSRPLEDTTKSLTEKQLKRNVDVDADSLPASKKVKM